jgi:peptide-methionine (S)-S-oxide reductase
MRARRRAATLVLPLLAAACFGATAASVPIPAPVIDAALAKTAGRQTAVVAGGCFWGVQAVFQHVRGVGRVLSGYSGGAASTAQYETVGTGRTGHAESVEIVYDPSVITYGKLLQVFFSVAHDPTERNRQGPDVGPQYRSVIFVADPEQRRIAAAYIGQLEAAKVFRRPIGTEIMELKGFFLAEDYHQDYATLHPNDPYIRMYDAPKIVNLSKEFPELFVARK